jgi:hypothetical protein
MVERYLGFPAYVRNCEEQSALTGRSSVEEANVHDNSGVRDASKPEGWMMEFFPGTFVEPRNRGGVILA